jgi:hypothetical protein
MKDVTNRTKSFLKSLVKHMEVWTILLLSVLLTAASCPSTKAFFPSRTSINHPAERGG